MASILVIEDCPITCELLATLLRKEGYEVMTANDGISGLKAARRQPDLAVIDLHLPDMSGVEVAGLLPADLPFLALTMDRSNEALQACIEKGALDYILKPIDPDRLNKHISVALQRGTDSRNLRRDDRNLRRALDHNHTIDKALGGLMGFLKLSEEAAESALKERSSQTNVKMIVLAQHIMEALAILSEAQADAVVETRARDARAFLNGFRKKSRSVANESLSRS